MEQQTTENKKGFFRNDRRLVCSMLVVYGLCILGLIATTFWWLDHRQRTISANATSTAGALATEEAKVTATAVARLAEQDQYEYVERFDKPSGYWYVGMYDENKKFGDTQLSIKDGVYIWAVADTKGFTQSIDFSKEDKVKDFDVYVDSKVVQGPKESTVCSGLFFRRRTSDWNDGAYTFSICNNAHFEVHYYGDNKWQTITYSEYERAIQPSEWNRMEISARGDHFTFIVNNTKVFEMTDDRLKEGGLGLSVNMDEGNSATIWFDNFGFQSR